MSYRKGPFKGVGENYTPTLGGTATTPENIANFRVDDNGWMHVIGYFTVTGAGSGAVITVGLPTTWNLDTARIPSTTSTDADDACVLGGGQWLDLDAGVWKPIWLAYGSANSVRININTGVLLDNAVANGDGVKYSFSVPVK